MKLTPLLLTFALLGPLPTMFGVEGQTPDRPSLAQFDEAVARSRRVMRQYCAITQEMIGADKADPTQQARALQALRDARAQWNAIQKQYAAFPPAEYAHDPDFKGRLQDIADAMDDMERTLSGGQARHSFRSCGYACGLFVAMHEDNGLDYALDKLFYLRKDLKTVQALMSTKGLSAVRGRIGSLLAKRDAVLAAPPHFAASDSRRPAYENAVHDLSRALDDLALALAAGDMSRVEKSLAQCTVLANNAYGMAL